MAYRQRVLTELKAVTRSDALVLSLICTAAAPLLGGQQLLVQAFDPGVYANALLPLLLVVAFTYVGMALFNATAFWRKHPYLSAMLVSLLTAVMAMAVSMNLRGDVSSPLLTVRILFERGGLFLSMYYLPIALFHAFLLQFWTVVRDARLRALQQQVAEEQAHRQLADVQLRLLHAQIEPHFLFNTLAHIDALIESRPTEAGVLLNRLISYLRAALPMYRQQEISLQEDCQFVRGYLDIQHFRFGKRFSYAMNIPDACASCALPTFMLLTLCENAIKHAIEPSASGGHLTLTAEKSADSLCIELRHGGVPLAENWREGYGLQNSRERLTRLYGAAAVLTLGRLDNGETLTQVKLPLRAMTP